MHRKTAWALLLACASAAAPAQAPPAADAAGQADKTIVPSTKQSGDAEFSRLDTNRDGALSPEELAAQARADRGYVAIDRDGDGGITRGEFSAFETQDAPDGSSAGD